MRLAVLSDIHGNLPALQAVLEDLQHIPIDGTILAGDYYACPDGSETRRLLVGLPGWKIFGNGEVNLRREITGEQPEEWHTLKQFALHRWVVRHMEAEDWAFVHSLPEQEVINLPATAPIRVTHGSHHNPFEEIFPDEPGSVLETVWDETQEAVFICGHTHIPWKRSLNGRLALNPGAVCGPLNGFVGAEYALLEWRQGRWQAELRQVRYDIETVRRAFKDSGLLEEAGTFARALIACLQTGRDITRDFLTYARRLAGYSGYTRHRYIPDAVWDQADKTFDWPEKVKSI